MNLYIPEIGDQIKLTSEWRFKLHAEHRNVALAAFYGYYQNGYSGGWLKEDEHPKMREIDYVIKYPTDDEIEKDFFGRVTYDARDDARRKAEENCLEYQKYWSDSMEWDKKAKQLEIKELDLVLPPGTILGIDRIYIRKGASDYSSITFFAKNLGEVQISQGWSRKKKVNKKSLRFWAKLSDCNIIEFEKVEK